jgi:hypothetical protein
VEIFPLSAKELQRASGVSGGMKGNLAFASAAKLLATMPGRVKGLRARLRLGGAAALPSLSSRP